MVGIRGVRAEGSGPIGGDEGAEIAERRDGRDVVLEHVGTAHDDAELGALMAMAGKKVYPGQGELDLGGMSGSSAVGRAGAAFHHQQVQSSAVGGVEDRLRPAGIRRHR